jgi:hypothetical protein
VDTSILHEAGDAGVDPSCIPSTARRRRIASAERFKDTVYAYEEGRVSVADLIGAFRNLDNAFRSPRRLRGRAR